MAGIAELRIVNAMLTVIGENQQSSLEILHPSVVQMRGILASKTLEVQARGWWFNREKNIKLIKDINGRVSVPSNALSFQVAADILKYMKPADKERYVKRGGYVYDNQEHTNVVNTDIVADLIYLLDLDDIPYVAQAYIEAICKEEANMSDDGDISKQNKLEDKTTKAWAALYSKELSILAVNALQSPQAQALRGGSRVTGSNPDLIGG